MHPDFGDNYTFYAEQYGHEETEELYDVDLILDTDATTLVTNLCILLNTKPFWMPQDTWNDRDNDVYLDLDTATFTTGPGRDRARRHIYSELLGTNETDAVRRPDNWSHTPPATPDRDYTRAYRDTARLLLTAPITTHVIPATAEDILALAPHTIR
ncbi:hypothetical protein N866_20145 [Actinotalea ferrariae CF5-4]|uniref:Uncharacterized protein n=1 Tax=Actinotalea ferrariae CF5-4 TaxID=948458 RepID=A0A021VU03_9CELL|nr:hypothetical protein [Actinotalea ferrariae]EYR63520.1 hypothetical protein N866_20145 [Actinotalea ferrariae CF5-4]